MQKKRGQIKKKDTFIDMTAMCDFTLLLLTFFIMATSFKPEESVEVVTAASTSTKEIPDGFILITLDKNGRVFYGVDNINAKRSIIDVVNDDKNLGLTEEEKNIFATSASIGVPFTQMKGYLSLPELERKKYADNAPGIPVDTTAGYTTNELAYWINVSRQYLDKGGRVAIKADGSSGYPDVSKIITTLGKQKIFNFSFITDMKGIPPGTALYDQQQLSKQAAGSPQ